MARIAVVLFNLGGPDSPAAVQPFLRNLFNDPAIIGVPQPVRGLLASFIARRRRQTAQQIYAEIGGSSPLLANTVVQARALEAALAERAPQASWQCFTAMRYWHPFAAEIVADVKQYDPNMIVLLPLYPQFSTTTTGSSLDDWRVAAQKQGLDVATVGVCCYPDEAGFVGDIAAATTDMLTQVDGDVRVLFTAHGLPEKIVARGDPYQWQVERTVSAVVAKMGRAELDWRVCYQSRVGPMTWIGPATEDEIRRAGADGKAVVMVPVAFVSEHSETLVELDIEYKELALAAGVPVYLRVPTVDAGAGFIGGLADVVTQRVAPTSQVEPTSQVGVTSQVAGTSPRALCDYRGGRVCPAGLAGCRVAAPGAEGAV